MDFLTQQFIAFTKKLRQELSEALSNIRADIQKHTEAVEKAAEKANKTANQGQAAAPVPLTCPRETQPVRIGDLTSRR